MRPRMLAQSRSMAPAHWPASISADRAPGRLPAGPLVEVRDLTVRFPNRAGRPFSLDGAFVTAVDRIALEVNRREVLGLVGESGSGKTTAGRAILGLIRASAGSLRFDGSQMNLAETRRSAELRRRMQIIFQDPFASLHPRMTVGRILEEPLLVQGIGDRASRRERALSLLELVGLAPEAVNRFPHQFSGGQRQRIAIARALALEPDFIVADEPVSALDVSIQAQILNLLRRLQQGRGLAMLFISHDLAVVRHISDRVAVMYLGRLVEVAGVDRLFRQPTHPYTMALMSAVPRVDAARSIRQHRIVLEGDPPSAANPPTGCRFHTRCWLYRQLGNPSACTRDEPSLRSTQSSHAVACHFAEQAGTRWSPQNRSESTRE